METTMKPSMQELLTACYEHQDEFSGREFDCLISLVDEGDIDSWEELAKYGVSKT